MKENTIIHQSTPVVKYRYKNGRRFKETVNVHATYSAVLHSVKDKPAIVKENGDKMWYHYGKLHRKNGPAMITQKGTFWFYEGLQHREGDLPAISTVEGMMEWYIHGKRHREGGPAVINPKKGNQYWVNGERRLDLEESEQ